jgi:hypothetical protein
MGDRISFEVYHFTDDEFLERFRQDLSESIERVIILSPFLAPKRALSYYPVLQSLIIRKVHVEIYAKPKSEQPDVLRKSYDGIVRRLKQIGVYFNNRTAMHEKIGIIDKRILWHGSLNILSHNNTKESMLRFCSTDLAEEIISDLGLDIHQYGLDKEPDLKVAETTESTLDIKEGGRTCHLCGGNMHYFEVSSMWICDNSPGCSGTQMVDSSMLKENLSEALKPIDLDCSICGSSMAVKLGVFTRIVCTSDKCGFSLDQRLSVGLLRVLRKKANDITISC